MTIDELIEKYKDDAVKLIEDLDTLRAVEYISYENKINLCQSIIENSYFVNKKFYSNTPLREILFIMSLIDFYTVIDVDFENLYDEYDKLTASGLIDFFFVEGSIDSIVPSIEIDRMRDLLGIMIDDLFENTRSLSEVARRYAK